MGSTTVGAGLVRPVGGPRAKVTVRALQEFLDRVVEQARTSYVQCMARAAVRRELHRIRRDHPLDRARSVAHAGASPAMTFVHQLLRLYRAGATPAELTALAAFPVRAMQQLAAETRPLDALDREETHLDGLEDEHQMRRRIQMVRPMGVSAAALREEAETCARAAALYQERERALLVEAARVERCGGMVA